MVGWVSSLYSEDDHAQVQALAEIGREPALDVARRFTANDVLPTQHDRAIRPALQKGDIVLFHARDDGTTRRAVNVVLASETLARLLREERTFERIDQLRAAVDRADKWQPSGPWLGQGMAVASHLMQKGYQLDRALDLLGRAAYEPSAGSRRGSGYAEVPEIHLFRALAYLLAGKAEEALQCLHELEGDDSEKSAFGAWLHLQAYLRSGRFPCTGQGFICLPKIRSILELFIDRPVFGPIYEISVALGKAARGRDKKLRGLSERSVRLFLELGARIEGASQVVDGPPAGVLSVRFSVPAVSEVVDASRVVLWVPLQTVAEDEVRYVAQKLLEHEGGSRETTSLGVIVVPVGTPETWELLRGQALDVEDVKFVATLMTREDIPLGRLHKQAAVDLVASLYRRISSYRNAFLRSLPVGGADFFGRREEMGRISQLIAGGNSVVVTGLRKSGKSSLLQELTPKLERMGHVVLRTRCLSRAWSDTSRQLLASVETVAERVPEWRGLNVGEMDARNVAAMVARIADSVQQRGGELGRRASTPPRLVLMIDEMDELLPGTVVSSLEQRAFLEFLANLRAYREEKAASAAGVPLVIVGTAVREAPCVTAMWQDRETGIPVQNPLFQQIVTLPLPPFSFSDLREMARKHGREMQLEFDPAAVWAVYRLTGGLPAAARRILGKVAARVLRRTPDARRVGVQDFVETVEEGLASEMVRSALGHYEEILRGDEGMAYRNVLESLLDLMDSPGGGIQPVPAREFLDLLEEIGSEWRSLVEAYHDLVRFGVIRLAPEGLELGIWGLTFDSVVSAAKRRQKWWKRLLEELDAPERWQNLVTS